MNTFDEQAEETDELLPYTVAEVQEQFMDYVRDIANYWVDVEGHDAIETIDGFMHSFHAAAAGSAGGLSVSLNLMVNPKNEEFSEVLGEVDINNDSLQYTFPKNVEKTIKTYKESKVFLDNIDEKTDVVPLMEEQLRLLWHLKVASIANEVADDSKNLSPIEQMYLFVRRLFHFMDNGDENFAKVTLIATPHPEDKEYHIEQGERWYEEENPINGGSDSLEDLWVEFLDS